MDAFAKNNVMRIPPSHMPICLCHVRDNKSDISVITSRLSLYHKERFIFIRVSGAPS
jgi:hypothetical protein